METIDGIELRFSYTFSDTAYGDLFYHLRVWRGKFHISILLTLLALASYNLWLWLRDMVLPLWELGANWILYAFDYHFWLAFLGLCLAIDVHFEFVQLFMRWLIYQRNSSKPSKVYDFTFNDEGASYHIESTTNTIDVKQGWSEFERVIESNREFLLVMPDVGYWTIPKKYFSSAEQLSAFRELLKHRIREVRE